MEAFEPRVRDDLKVPELAYWKKKDLVIRKLSFKIYLIVICFFTAADSSAQTQEIKKPKQKGNIKYMY